MEKINTVNQLPRFLKATIMAFIIICSLLLLSYGVYAAEDCAGVDISVNVGCEPSNSPIFAYLSAIIRFLSAGVGIVVVLMIVVSGIEYIVASGNPQLVQDAKKKLGNAIMALLLFIFMFAILNFLIPGGIL